VFEFFTFLLTNYTLKRMNTTIGIIFSIMILASAGLPQDASQYILPPQNYRHWTKLQEVCEDGRKTYGANEYIKKEKVCRWTFVPYWPDNTPPRR
jgi:hypothetical protein